MPNRISVTIAGQSYTILAEENEEYTRRVAQRADHKIQEARQATEASPLNAAVLAALNLADEATKAEREALRLHSEGSERTEQIEAMRNEILRLQEENDQLKQALAAFTAAASDIPAQAAALASKAAGQAAKPEPPAEPAKAAETALAEAALAASAGRRGGKGKGHA